MVLVKPYVKFIIILSQIGVIVLKIQNLFLKIKMTTIPGYISQARRCWACTER